MPESRGRPGTRSETPFAGTRKLVLPCVDRLVDMADPQEVLAQRVRHALAAAFGPEHADDDPVIRPSQFADYQSNVALPLSKRLGRPPREVAAELVRHLDVTGVSLPPEVSGPGFINLTL